MGATDEYGTFPDVDSNVAPADLQAWSVAPSASAQVEADLETQTNLRRIAEQRTVEIQARCDALKKSLEAATTAGKKRKASRDRAAGAAASAGNRPKKRASPLAIVDIMGSQLPDLVNESDSSDLSESSDDEVPEPPESGAKKPTYHQLHSILCEYKEGNVKPTFNGDLSFKLCAELCEQEVANIGTWTSEQRKERRPMIVSALRLTYKDKKEEWFSKPFLLSPDGAAQWYWCQVLQRRASIWRAAHDKAFAKAQAVAAAAATAPVASSMLPPVRDRIKALIAANKSSKSPTSAARTSPKAGKQHSPIVVSSGSEGSPSSSGSSDDSGDDLSKRKSRKLAPGPDKYTPDEIKRYASMAKTIRNVDEAKGHSLAVADFIDLEFSGNRFWLCPHLLSVAVTLVSHLPPTMHFIVVQTTLV